MNPRSSAVSETGWLATCPPFVKCSGEFQVRAAKEPTSLPEDTLITGWLADYSVMRDQARSCLSRRP